MKYKINLTIFDRSKILDWLPKEGHRSIGLVILDLRDDLGLTKDEREKAFMPVTNDITGEKIPGQFIYTDYALSEDSAKEYIWNDITYETVKQAIKKIEEEGKLPVDRNVHNLYSKVMDVEQVSKEES